MKASDKLLENCKELRVSKDYAGRICVRYFLGGESGYGKDFEEACEEYLKNISTPWIVITEDGFVRGR